MMAKNNGILKVLLATLKRSLVATKLIRADRQRHILCIALASRDLILFLASRRRQAGKAVGQFNRCNSDPLRETNAAEQRDT